MAISAEERRLRLSLHGGARGFDLRLRIAFKSSPRWFSIAGNRFSAILRLWGFVVELKSEAPSFSRRISSCSNPFGMFRTAVKSSSPAKIRRRIHRTPPRKGKFGGLIECLVLKSRNPASEDGGRNWVYRAAFILLSLAPWILFSLPYLHSLKFFADTAWSVFFPAISLAGFFLVNGYRVMFSKAPLHFEGIRRLLSWTFIIYFLFFSYWNLGGTLFVQKLAWKKGFDLLKKMTSDSF
ncbi:uncharacterized protein LOC144715657 [Wolffia australiana]